MPAPFSTNFLNILQASSHTRRHVLSHSIFYLFDLKCWLQSVAVATLALSEATYDSTAVNLLVNSVYVSRMSSLFPVFSASLTSDCFDFSHASSLSSPCSDALNFAWFSVSFGALLLLKLWLRLRIFHAFWHLPERMRSIGCKV